MVKSSLPFSSPLMTTDLPMFTLSLSRNWLASARGLGVATVGGWGVGAPAGCPLGGCTAWSRFHMGSSACLLARVLGCQIYRRPKWPVQGGGPALYTHF